MHRAEFNRVGWGRRGGVHPMEGGARKNGPSANGKRRRGAVGSEVVGEDRMLTEGLFGIGGCDTG